MPLTTLSQFSDALRHKVGEATDVRPFVCDGSPLECKVFIVGFNPATGVEGSFWNYWSNEQGFNKAAWFERYKIERQQRPLKPGKMRRNTVSNTRRVIDWVVAAALPVKCLETNIFSIPSSEAAELTGQNRVSDIFDFLVEAVSPRLLVAHGKDAAAHVAKRHSQVEICQVSHFSRGWSRERAMELGFKIRRKFIE